MKKSAETMEGIINWDFIKIVEDFQFKETFTLNKNLYEVFTKQFNNDKQNIENYLQENLFIKGNKPHAIYANPIYIDNLSKTDSKDFANHLKINIGLKNYGKAKELIFGQNKIKASTIKCFREY